MLFKNVYNACYVYYDKVKLKICYVTSVEDLRTSTGWVVKSTSAMLWSVPSHFLFETFSGSFRIVPTMFDMTVTFSTTGVIILTYIPNPSASPGLNSEFFFS